MVRYESQLQRILASVTTKKGIYNYRYPANKYQMLEVRPKIKINLSQPDKYLETASLVILFLMWGLTIYTFIKLPNTIATHFNALGKVDDYGSKMTMLSLPILITLMFIGLTQLNKYPHIFNYITKITEENAAQQYTMATRMLRFLKLSLLIISTVIILLTYLTTIGITKGLGVWFIPLVFGLTNFYPIFLMIKTFKTK